MFEIATNGRGVACVITDNPKIADVIHEEEPKVPVWFIGVPTKETARALAEGLAREFNCPASYRAGGHCAFHAGFVK